MKKNVILLLVVCVCSAIFGYILGKKKSSTNTGIDVGEEKASDETDTIEVTFTEVTEEIEDSSGDNSEDEYVDFDEDIREILDRYQNNENKKPYIIDEYVEEYEYWETKVVYDKSKGRAICEDGDEIVNINGTLGLRNLRELSKVENGEEIRIMNELDECIYVVHAGDISEYLDEE